MTCGCVKPPSRLFVQNFGEGFSSEAGHLFSAGGPWAAAAIGPYSDHSAVVLSQDGRDDDPSHKYAVGVGAPHVGVIRGPLIISPTDEHGNLNSGPDSGGSVELLLYHTVPSVLPMQRCKKRWIGRAADNQDGTHKLDWEPKQGYSSPTSFKIDSVPAHGRRIITLSFKLSNPNNDVTVKFSGFRRTNYSVGVLNIQEELYNETFTAADSPSRTYVFDTAEFNFYEMTVDVDSAGTWSISAILDLLDG